jgi:hypothetical protein
LCTLRVGLPLHIPFLPALTPKCAAYALHTCTATVSAKHYEDKKEAAYYQFILQVQETTCDIEWKAEEVLEEAGNFRKQ